MFRRLFVLAIGIVAMLALAGAVAAQVVGKASTSSAPEGCPMNFSDVQPGSTFYPYVLCLYCQNIIGGYGDGTFRPNNNVTRGQLSKIVSESAGFNGDPGLQLYEDVQPGTTYYTYVNRLAQFGYVSGYPCGGPGEQCSPQMYRYFRPNGPATRGQIAKIVSQAAGWLDPAGNQIFEDVAPGSTFYDFIQRLSMHNAVSGYPCGGAGEPCNPPGNRPYFRPDSLTTRGQLSKIDVYAFFPACIPPSR